MSSYPVKPRKSQVSKVEKDATDVIGPDTGAGPFFSFRYSYTEISAAGGKAHIKSRKARFEGGELTSETFEGDLDRRAYEQMLGQAQQYIFGQTALVLGALTSLLPFSRKARSDGD